ncbi:10268_t:CDS:2, partial [Gigaspora rosea]
LTTPITFTGTETLTIMSSTHIKTHAYSSPEPAVPTCLTTSRNSGISKTSVTSMASVVATTTACKETTKQKSAIQTAIPNPKIPKWFTSSSYSLTNGRPPIIILPTETITFINKCTNIKECHTDTEIKAIGKIFTSTDRNEKTSLTSSNKTITKFKSTTFIKAITQIYQGYTTTKSTLIYGKLTIFETYYPPSTIVVIQTVTAYIPIIDNTETFNNNAGINFIDYGLINIIWSLW